MGKSLSFQLIAAIITRSFSAPFDTQKPKNEEVWKIVINDRQTVNECCVLCAVPSTKIQNCVCSKQQSHDISWHRTLQMK